MRHNSAVVEAGARSRMVVIIVFNEVTLLDVAEAAGVCAGRHVVRQREPAYFCAATASVAARIPGTTIVALHGQGA